MCAKLLQSSPTLCDPMDSSPPGSSVHGILQARVLERAAISSPWTFLTQESNLCLRHLLHWHWQADSLPLVPPVSRHRQMFPAWQNHPRLKPPLLALPRGLCPLLHPEEALVSPHRPHSKIRQTAPIPQVHTTELCLRLSAGVLPATAPAVFTQIERECHLPCSTPRLPSCSIPSDLH